MTTKICGKAVEGSPLTLVDLLRRHAASAASSSDAANAKSEISSGFTWMDDSGNVARKLTYGDLEREARAVAQGLQAKKAQSQRVLLVFEPGLDFIIGFFGCVYAGAIAVPVYPPIKDEDFFKLDGLVIDCEARFMLTTSAVYKSLQRKLLNPLARGGYALKKLLPVAIDLLDRTPSAWSPPDVSPTSPAYLQYTSGSTAFPKGVVVTHANAVYNAVAISHLLDTQAPRQLGLCWLPLYHDMGLVGNVLSVLYSRMPMMLMAPSSFLKRPDMFLQLVARHRVTHVAAPNFAYELCARKLPDAFARELDLSHLRVALNGAEQVQASTLQRFSDKFAPSGFTMDKFYACYGLAEATLILTGGQQGMPPTLLPLPAAAAGGAASGGKPSDLLVACGTGLPEGEIRIVDPVSHKPCPSLSVGEIWARGPGVSPGYYGQPDRTEEVFAAKVAEGAQEEQSSVSAAPVYMRTGDLGFVNEKGELFVTGRLKDLIIVRGRNIYPLDIEWTIHNTSDLIRPGCCAVFSVRLDEHEREQEEKVVAVAELRQPIADSKERDELVQSIKAAVARGFDGLELHDVVLVQDHTVPKTSSGKLMRFACRYSYLQASLARLDSSRRHYQQQHQASPSQTQRQAGGLVGGVVGKLVQVFKPRRDALQRFIVSKVAEAVELDAANIDPSCDVRSYGMDSLRQMQLLRELEDRLGCALPTSLCDEYNSIEQIVDLLLSDAYTKISPRLIKFIDEELAAFKPEKRRERRKGSFDLMREESQAKGEEDDDSDDDDDEEEDVSVAAEDVSAASIREPAAPELPEGYPTEDGEPIAIVGMACRVPKAKNLGEFWANLETGVDAISRIPADRWNAEAFYDADMDKPGKMPTTQGGFLEDIDKFDAGFFHIGAREAEVMDPQQRMVLEVVYEALEDAGMAMEKLRGSRTGVFTGVCFSDYHKVQVADPDKIRPYVQTGCASSIVPNRVSYFYDLKGPSFTVDTACSSSLVALHLACESIRRGECDRAIVAGTSTNLLPEMFIAFAKLHMLSPNGRCRAFDASGDGYVRSEGICVLVIEPLATAARERDAVRALVRATGTNQDGRTAGLTFPGRDAQAALLREVYARAKLSPLDVQFIEAHGTGTRAGDPVEAGAIGSVLGEVRPRDNPLLIGSVKSNIGHLEGASGLAGLIKAVLAMERGIIPANLHFHTPNPDIDFDAMRLKVAASSLPWPACPVRRAGVNSFGFGGSNAHAVLEQAPHLPALALHPSRDQQRQRRHQRPSSSSSSTAAAEQQQEEKQTTSGAEVAAAAAEALPVVLSAHTKQALADLQAAYAARLAGGGDGLGLGEESDGERLMDLAYTLSCRRTHHAYRLSAVVSSAAELAAELPKAKISKMREADKEKKVLFVFTGQGAQWYAMGRQLLRAEPVFLASMRECDRIVRGLVGWSVLEVLAQDEATSIVNRPDIAQPCTTSLQVSLVRLWRHWGVEPAVVVGHSSGEIATAYAAGALSLEATIRTAVMRGEAMKVNESGKGKMAAVGMNEQEAAEFLAPYQGRVGIAAVNSPTNCTISGDADAMDEIGRVLQERGVFCQFLRIDCAYHSHHMVPVGNRLTELLTGLETLGGDSAPTRVPMISTVLGAPCLASDLGADYWVRNLVSMVRFWPAIEAAFQQSPLLPKIDVVVEIGPHPALQGPLRQCLLALSSQPPAVLPSLIRKEDEHRRIMLSLCALHEAGVEVAWSRVFRDKLLQGHREPRLVRGLPSFPWQRKSYWHESDISRQSRFRELGHELLGHRLHQAHGAALWQNELKVPHLPYLKDHVVQGSIVFPGAGYIAMAAAIPTEAKAGAQQQQQPQGSAPEPVAIEEIVFKKALLFETDQTPVKTQLTLADKPDDEGRRDFTVFSADGSAWQEHCSGKHRRLGPAAAAQADAETAAAAEANRALMQAVRDRCPHFVSKDECYKVFNDAGLEYGPDFQGIEELHRGDGEAWAVVSSVPCALPPAGSSYAIHPTVLDACFQVLIGAVGGSLSESYLPVRIGKVEVRSACREAKYFVHATAKKPAQGSFVGDIRLFGLADAREKVAVEGLLCASIGKKGGAKKGEEDGAWEWNESLYEFVWKPDLAQLVRTGLVARAVPPTDAPWDDEPERVTLAYLRRVAASFAADPAKRDRLVPLYRPLLDWIDAAVLAATEEPETGGEASSLLPAAGGAFFGAEEEKGLADESLVVHRIGFHLEEILLGATDPLSLLFKDDTVYRVYEKGPTFYQANQVLGHALDLLAHKHGQLRVLEIGAGTGGTTSHALPVLGKRFASYTFTDISPSFFEKAKAKFAPWAGRMKFQVLDIEKDVEAQGFAPESFDLIVATDVLHATVDIVRTLTNVRGLLAPGGHLLMNEFVNTPMWIQTVFGTLSGWWRFQDPERRSVGPTLSEQAWRQAFLDSGWAHVHPLHDRRPRPIHATFLATTAAAAADITGVTAPVYVLADELDLTPSEQQQPQQQQQEAVIAHLASLCVAAQRELVRVREAAEVPAHASVVYLPSLSSPAVFEGVSDGEFERMKAVVGRCGEVYWVTRGGNMDCPLPQNAPLVGFSRVMKNERPGIKSCVVDVDPLFAAPEVAASIFEALTSPHLRDEDEVVVRREIGTAGTSPEEQEHRFVFVPRVALKKVSQDLQRTEDKHYRDCAGLRLEVGTAGLLNTLQWRESQRRAPGKGEVEVQVMATGLNFKDVMLAMGMLSDEAVEGGFCGKNLGIECAGVVAAVGEGASAAGLAVGQRVVCVARYCFSTYVTTLAPLVQPIPEWMTFEEAATIPATFLTALYALKNLGQIQAGEKVLIHAAAGGVGQAAIQLAHLFGAEVYATVGTRDKREFIERELGVHPDRIMNSRNLDFVQEVLEKTGGRGVDLVLNSLSGEALKKSVGVLAPFGRFLEIGKRDIYGNSKLDLLPFGQNLSFFAIDLDRLNGSHPETSGRIFKKLMQLFYERKLTPLPRKVYSFGRVEEAFRYMQQGKHIGKVILALRPDEPVRTLLPAFSFDPRHVYLLVGGLGGFGTAVARWMILHGATKLAFLSRSGASSPAAALAVQELAALGADLAVEKADAVDHAQLRDALARIRAHFPHASFGGVMQAAMVLDDCLLDDMTAERFRRVVAPKVRGTHNLVDLLAAEPLRFFVLFSSVSAVVGNLAQSNYAAANAYLDALAHHARAARALPLVSINWGAIGDVGYVAERKDLEESMKKRGIYTLPIDHALHVLQWAITDLPVQVVASPILWKVAANTLPSLTSARFRSLLVDDGGEGEGSGSGSGSSVSVFQQLSAAPEEERLDILRQSLRHKLSSMLGISAEDIEMSNKLTDLGVDSLMAVELKNWIDKEMKISLSVLDLTGGKSIDELVVKILSLSSLAPLASSTTSADAADPTVSVVSSSSDVEKSGEVGAVFECYQRVEKPKARLVCFPYLGGEPSAFKSWVSFLPSDVELLAYVPQRLSTWEELLPLITQQLALLDQAAPAPLVFYGHSMGGLIAYEVASLFRPSSQLVVAAIASPDEPSFFATEWEGWSDAVLAAAPVEDFMRVAMQQGLIVNTTLNPEIIRSSILLGKRYLPWRKATGLCGQGRKQMQSRLLAVDGENDLIFKDKTHILSWRDYTAGAFEFLSIAEGSHLFLNEEVAMSNFIPALSAVLDSAAQ